MNQVQSIVQFSDRIVTVHYDIVDTSDELIESFLSLIEHQRKYQILDQEDELQKYLQEKQELDTNLQTFLEREHVQSTLDQVPDENTPPTQNPFQNEDRFLPEEKFDTWVTYLGLIRDYHRQEVSAQLQALNRKGQQAVFWGSVGIAATVFFGLMGSFGVAYFMHRSAKELKKGIEKVGKDGAYQPIKVLSQDEIGELARAFNKMSERLKQEEKNRADFISMLSHEIRTPLTSIYESINLLHGEVLGPITDKQVRFLQVSSQEVERLSSLLKRLMYVSNLDFKEIPIRPTVHRISDIVHQTLTRVESLSKSKDIYFITDIFDEYIEVLADGEHLQQVMANLVGNAVKFSSSGGRIWITAAPDGNNHNQVRFSITDEGPGIPLEEQKYVFCKYYRGPSVRETVDGAGLGLSISLGIVQAHGGQMWMESTTGKGSTFSFSLPRNMKLQGQE
ncbi:MAG: HAMP domain-containing sensor histidine kinase [Desulfovermiculus sp.]